MMTKQHYITIAIIALLACIGLSGCSSDLGADKEVKEWEKPGKEYLTLKAPKDKILFVEEADDIRCSDELDPETCENKGKVKKYLYISDKKIKDEKLEKDGKQYDVYKRTKNAVIYKIDKPKDLLGASEDTKEYFVGKFYTGNPFYEDPATGDYYQTETATTTIEAYEDQTFSTSTDMVLGASESVYGGTTDGFVLYDGTGWSTVRNATVGTGLANSSVNLWAGMYIGASNNAYTAYNSFPTFNVSIGETSEITSASLNLYVWNISDSFNDSYAYLNIYEGKQASYGALVLSDYAKYGSVKLANDLDISIITNNAYNSISLNSNGLATIENEGISSFTILEGHQIDNVQFTGPPYYTATRISFKGGANTGTSQDPYLEITYTEGGGDTPEPIRHSEFWF